MNHLCILVIQPSFQLEAPFVLALARALETDSSPLKSKILFEIITMNLNPTDSRACF